ncbi:MAG: hypothetical protein ACI8O8_002899 [Oleiphilaceae bacterium]|jgi:uncharacterized protein (UPF0332 family)
MAIDTKEIVTYAREMLNGGNCSEIEIRNIINRSYYGAFLTARDKAGIDNRSASVHGEVIEFFFKPANNSRIANNLIALKKCRHQADYQPSIDISYQEAKNCVARAWKIIQDLNR